MKLHVPNIQNVTVTPRRILRSYSFCQNIHYERKKEYSVIRIDMI